MPAALIATPLPEVAGVRLELFAAADQQIVVSEDYRSQNAALNAGPAATWSGSGDIAVTAAAGSLGIGSAAAFTGAAYVERTMTGLTAGRTYQVALSMMGWGGTPALALRVDTTVPTTKTVTAGLYGVTGVGPDVVSTPFWLTFIATATTHTLRLTPGTTTYHSPFIVWQMDVRWVGANTKRLELDFASDDSANWTNGGPAVTNGLRAISYVSHSFGPYFPTRATYRRTPAGSTATYAADTQFVQRTVTGLTAGRSYRVTVSPFAYMFGTGSRLRARVGVTGSGESAASTENWLTYDFVATATSHVLYVKIADAFTANDNQDTFLDVQYVRVIDRYTDLTDIYSLVSLTRSDVNGSAPVRLAADQEFDAGSLVATDYEPALSGLVTYEALLLNSTTTLVERVAATANLTGQVTEPVLSPATLPQFQTTVRLLTNRYSASRSSMGTVHEVIGRMDPLVTLGALRSRQDSYEVLVDSYEHARVIQEVYQRGEVVLLRDPTVPGADMYHVAQRVSLVPDQSRWLMTVEYVEVVRPTGPLLGALGWTFDAALTALGTFDGARAAYPTFNDYTVGPN